jgi:hypothetical protein
MDTSPTGWLAVFQARGQGEGEQSATTLPVVGWGPEGEALVVHARFGRRMAANDLPGFQCLQEADALIVTVLPGQGWQMIHHDAATPWPVIGWAIDVYGWGTPLIAGADGIVAPHDITPDSTFIPPGRAPEES